MTEVNPMVRNRVFRAALLAAGVSLIAASALQAASPPDPAETQTALLEKKFQQTAQSYMKFQDKGEIVYCKKEKPITSAIPAVQCLSESQLRLKVENRERSRNLPRPSTG
jgi:hypothetical protein